MTHRNMVPITKLAKLAKPRNMSGVGDKAKTCEDEATIFGKLPDGTIISYPAPVIPGPDSYVPPLYGLDSMAAEHTYVGSHNGLLAMVPSGRDSEIRWPVGTKFIQCTKAPSGHWLITISHWNVDPIDSDDERAAVPNPQSQS